jgi:hypothetical protein
VKKPVPLLYAVCALIVPAYGEIRFSVTTDEPQVMVGDHFTVTATVVSDKEIADAAAPAFPGSEYYSVLRTSTNQHQTSSIQIINNKMTQTREITYIFSYAITALKEGTAAIPALTFSGGGETAVSKPFTVSIVKQQSAGATSPLGVSAALSLDKKRMYIGEPAILTFRASFNLQSPARPSQESFNVMHENIMEALSRNFSGAIHLQKGKLHQTQSVINGQNYAQYTLSYSIFPTTSGSFSISSIPFTFVEERQVRSRDLIDEFFGGSFYSRSVQQIPKATQTNGLSGEILPLPPAPSGFKGAVGTFSLDASVNQTSVAAGDAITLQITLRGNTRPGNMGELTLPEMSGFDLFTPEKNTAGDTTLQGITSVKRYKYLIIPREPGTLTIPSISFPYFDPRKASYLSATTQPIPITVTKGTKSVPQPTRYLSQEDIREVGQDIRYIQTPSHITHQPQRPYHNPVFFVLFPVPFLLALFATLYRLQATVLKRDPAAVLRKKALATARRSCVALSKTIGVTAPAQAVSKIADIIETYITHRFGFAAQGKTLDALREELDMRHIDVSVTGTLVPFLEMLDRCRFGGSVPDKKTVAGFLSQARDMIEKLELKEDTRV